jgi:adenylyltransferase/sulfurtransferase
VHGSIFQFEGQATVSTLPGPCYRCSILNRRRRTWRRVALKPGAGSFPADRGHRSLGSNKLILGKGDSLVGRLLCFNTLTMEINTLHLRRDPNCPMCGDHPTIHQLIDYEEFCSLRTSF